MQENFNNISNFTIEDVENYANSKHIESYYYTYSISLDGENIMLSMNISGKKYENEKEHEINLK